ncbi:MAG: SNF2 helicase-associated domain-containing protein, partial [Nitriliruptoraceae bacterium]
MPRPADPPSQRLPGVVQALFWPGEPVPSAGHLALWGVEDAELDAAIAALGFHGGRPAVLRTLLPRTARARTRVAVAEVPARLVPVLPATGALVALPPAEDTPAWRRPSDSVLTWSLAAKLATELVAAGRVVPGLRVAGERGVAGWRCAPGEDRRLEQVATAMPPAGHALLRDEDETTVWRPGDLLRAYLDAVADACARGTERRVVRSSQLATGWVRALRSHDPVLDLPADGHTIAADLTAWAAPLVDAERSGSGRLCLRLELPEDPAALDGHGPPRSDPRSAAGTWRLEYLLQAADDPSLLVPAAQVWAHADGGLRAAEREFAEAQETLVRGLAGAARLFPALASSLDEAAPTHLDLEAPTAGEFLAGAASLSAAGIGVLLPAELTTGGQRRLRARLRARTSTSTPAPGNERAGGLDADALASFTWEAALGDETIDADEFARIVALKQPLVRWRGHWVRVDPDEAATLADLVGGQRTADPAEVLGAALTGERTIERLGSVEVVAEGALATVVSRLRDGT